MRTILSPYLSFRDNAAEAMRFYQSVFGGNLTLKSFEIFHSGNDGLLEQSKTIHSVLVTDSGLVLMASDTPSAMEYVPGTNHSISLSCECNRELRTYWRKLSKSGRVVVPLATSPDTGTFGTCIDRFGIVWLLGIQMTGHGADQTPANP
ncbi:VOC family protein [Arthrobacter sp. Y-9]|uniref:VOC family protein n=1 Tax=Arthrobacter sp. Y-9 TaxID=3039385 RepID=UPI00241D3850|nr:VOC family protein [Arthrobacter sp. Y-9]WFR84311.1 VOC family protein [Arthrobacter sp. Y-9]